MFAYRSELVARLVPALELGRSFVRLEYQKTYSALLLLWRAIAEFVVRSPRYKLLFGVVSISNDFRGASQRRIVEYLRGTSSLPGLARFVRSRSPLSAISMPLRRPAIAAGVSRRSSGRFSARAGSAGCPSSSGYLKLAAACFSPARDPVSR